MGRLRVHGRTGSSPNIEKLSGLVRLYNYATTQSKECKKFRPVQVAPGGKQKGQEGQKRQKYFLPFLPFLLPFDHFTKPFARPLAQVEILRFSSTGPRSDPNDRLPRGAIYLHHRELDLRRILFGVVDGVARDDAF